MAFSEQVRIVVDFVTKKTGTGLSGIKDDVAKAEGSLGKLKTGIGGVIGSLGNLAGPAALGAGSALVAFGTKAIGAFEDLALAASKFSDATGLAVEDASRWMEVA